MSLSLFHLLWVFVVVVVFCYVRSFSVNLLSLELTYFCSGLLFAAVVRRRVWDYALTVTLLHVIITSLGDQKSDNTSTQVCTHMTECVVKLNVLFPRCSDVRVPHGVAVVAGFR